MKRIQFVLIVCAVLFLTTPLFAGPFENAGLTVVSERSEEGGRAYSLQDADGNQFTCLVEGGLTDQTAASVQTLAKRFYGWQHIAVSSIRFRITAQQIEAGILLKDSTYKGVALVPHVPAGLQFFLRDTLEYDFRIASQNNFIRLKGWYFTEEQLLDRIVTAVKNPGDFIKSQDPEYLFNALSALEKDFAELTERSKESEAALALLTNAILTLHNKSFFGAVSVIPPEVIERVLVIREENPALTQKEILAQLKAEGITATAKAVSLILAVYFNQFE